MRIQPPQTGGPQSANRSWRVAAASAIGTSHATAGTACQDAHAWREMLTPNGSVVVAVVSDGAGTAMRSAEGAAMACSSLVEMVTATVEERGVRGLDRPRIEAWIDEFQEAVRDLAQATEARPRDFACTLVAAVVSFDWSVFLQIGDGTIVVRHAADPDFGWVFWPESGEYANTTFFLTEDRAATHLQFEEASFRYTELALLTDGLQRLVLNFADRTVHQPFFANMFRVLGGGEAPPDQLLGDRLGSYLESETVNARTDDDKTLILLRHAAASG